MRLPVDQVARNKCESAVAVDFDAQRVMGLASGYKDLNDHDELRSDPTWATLAGKKEDPVGLGRTEEGDRGKPLASKATLGRLEHAPETAEQTYRYHQVTASHEQIEDLFIEDLEEPEEPIVLDLDATHDLLHGDQEEKFFHGYYDCYCYLPLYIFYGDELLCAKLRRSNVNLSEGCLPEASGSSRRSAGSGQKRRLFSEPTAGLPGSES